MTLSRLPTSGCVSIEMKLKTQNLNAAVSSHSRADKVRAVSDQWDLPLNLISLSLSLSGLAWTTSISLYNHLFCFAVTLLLLRASRERPLNILRPESIFSGNTCCDSLPRQPGVADMHRGMPQCLAPAYSMQISRQSPQPSVAQSLTLGSVEILT